MTYYNTMLHLVHIPVISYHMNCLYSTTYKNTILTYNVSHCMTSGNFLCPTTAPLRCQYACYTSTQYTCSNGQLSRV